MTAIYLAWLTHIALFQPIDASYMQMLIASIVMAFLLYAQSCFLGIRFASRHTAVMLFAFIGASAFAIAAEIVIFAAVFRILGLVGPDHQSIHDAASCVYFSMITWTTVGYGDFVPTPAARMYASTEALLGYVFMALFISTTIAIVANYAPKPTGTDS
jgi:hypothetical protein